MDCWPECGRKTYLAKLTPLKPQWMAVERRDWTMLKRLISHVPERFRDRHRARWLRFIAEVSWWWSLLRRGRQLPAVDPEGMRIHLGCGSIDIPGYINVDKAPHPHVHYRLNLNRLSAFPDGCASLIYASHCLEHFSFRQVPYVLRDWGRILKPGGILRLAVPNLDVIIEAYEKSGHSIETVQMPLLGGQNYRLNYHYAVFNANHLRKLLEDSGFEGVIEWSPGVDKWTPSDIRDGSNSLIILKDEKLRVSLNIQGIKSKEPVSS